MATRIWVVILSLSSCFLCSAGVAQAAPVSPQFLPPTVGILVKFNGKHSSGFLRALQNQVGGIFRPTGLELRWEVLGGNKRPGTYDRVVIIEMRGSCDLYPPYNPPDLSEPNLKLGWTIVNNGEVLPYAVVDCDRIAGVVSRARLQFLTLSPPPAVYARLASRVVAHELMHVLLRTSDHDRTDCTRSPLKATDLPIEPRLAAKEIAALRQIGRTRRETVARRD